MTCPVCHGEGDERRWKRSLRRYVYDACSRCAKLAEIEYQDWLRRRGRTERIAAE